MSDDEEAEIIIGTYEDYVVGYRIECLEPDAPQKKKLKSTKETNGTTGDKQTTKTTKRFSLEQTFAVRGHSGSVKCLTASADGSLVLSAGFDEMLNLFGLKRRKLLQTSEAAINCAAFVENSHLICGSEDGNIYIYECKKSAMTQVKTLKGHKLPVTSLSVHPSGKVLLSLSKDNTMRTWNLIKGRSAYITNIKAQAHLVCWSRDGDSFMIAANNEVYLYNNSGNLEHSIKLDKRINSIEFITENIFIVATDSGNLDFFDLKKGVLLMKFEGAHETRIKSVKCLVDIQSLSTGSGGDNRSSSLHHFVTASSDGVIKLWSIDEPKAGKLPIELAKVETGTRLTCMTSVIHKDR